MNPEQIFTIPKPEDYSGLHNKLSKSLNRERFWDDSLGEQLLPAATASSMLHSGGDVSPEEKLGYENAIIAAEDTMDYRKDVTASLKRDISPTVKSIRRVGSEVRSKMDEFSKMREDFSIEIARHQITDAKHNSLLSELHQAERFIDAKNAIIKDLRHQLEEVERSTTTTDRSLEITKEKLTENLNNTEEEVTKLQAAVENIKAIKFEKRNFPEAKSSGAPAAQPETQIKTTPEKKEGLVMTPEFAVKAVDHHLLTINRYMSSGNKVYEQAAIDFVDKIKKQLDRCEDENIRDTQKARLDEALKKPASTPAAPAAEATAPPQTTTPTAAKEIEASEPTETKTSPAAKKISLGAAAIAAGTLALGAVGPDQKQDQDFTYRLASVGNKIETPTNQIETVEKIGNVTVDTRLKTITINGNDSPLLLEALEKKGDYYIGSYNYGGVIKYIAVPDLNTLKSLSAAKNDEEIKILISPFANKVLDENPEMKGVSVVCGQSRTEDGVKRIISFNFKRQGSEVKEAKDGHITPKENPLAKEIFGKKYSEYVKEVSNKKLGELKNIPEGNIRVELQKLADILRVYKYNDWAQRETIDNLLKETLKKVV